MATSWKVWLSSFHSIGYSFITQTPFEICEKTPLYITLGYDPLFNAIQEKNIPPGWRNWRHHMWRNSSTLCGLISCCCHVIAFTRLAIILYRKLPFWSPTPFPHKLIPPTHPSYTLGDKSLSKCIEENSITTFWPLIKNQKIQTHYDQHRSRLFCFEALVFYSGYKRPLT